jgi:hypothetical protein
MKCKLSLLLIVVLQTVLLQSQRVESSTGYWYNGAVTHAAGIAKAASNEPRPLRQAVESLADEYGWSVDYEDPIYSNADVVDRTDPAFIASHPGVKQHLVAGHKFESQFPETTNTGTSVTEEETALRKVVADYNQSGNPGKFTLLAEGGRRFAVVGQASGPSGATILDTPISLAVGGTTGSWALAAFCKSLTNASGTTVKLMAYPLNVLVQTSVTSIQATNQPARDVLREITALAPQKLEWSLLYDIDDQAYSLNLIPVAKVTIDKITGVKMRQWVH